MKLLDQVRWSLKKIKNQNNVWLIKKTYLIFEIL